MDTFCTAYTQGEMILRWYMNFISDIKLPEFDRDNGLFPGKFGTPGVWLVVLKAAGKR